MDLIERLRGTPVFGGASAFYLQRLAEIAEERRVLAGTVLTRQAELGATFFVLDSGEAVIHRVDEQGLRRPVGVLRAGDSFGTTSLFVGEPRDATVTAVTEIRLWLIQRAPFQALLVNYPGMRQELRIPQEIRSKLVAPRYPWLEPGEVVVYHDKRHWIVFAGTMLGATLVWLVALTVGAVLVFRMGITSRVGLYIAVPATALYLLYAIWQWVDWQNDYFAVSTLRVTHREQVAFLYESRQEAPLEQVQNINVTADLLGNLMGYGNLTIVTAAQMAQMRFSTIPFPERLRAAVFNEIARARATRRALQRHLIQQDLVTHMNLQLAEAPPETRPGAEGAVMYAEQQAPVPQPWLARAIQWLSAMGLLVRTRYQEGDAITWRKHWLFLIRKVSSPLALGLVSGVLFFLSLLGIPAILVNAIRGYAFMLLVPIIVAIGWFWWESTDWANDLYTLTSERIIDIEKRPLFFSEQRREANLGMIQNVSLEMPNAIAALLNYGDVIVKTAGGGDFTFNNVSNPRDVQREVFRHIAAYKQRLQQQDDARRRAEMAEWFSVFDELQRSRGVRPAESPRPEAGNP